MRKAIASSLAGLLLLASAAQAAPLDDEVLAEINFARASPAEYARRLPRMRGTDPKALAEAVDFLMSHEPLPPLKADPRLAAAAQIHTVAQGQRGDVGHSALAERLRDQGVWASLTAENISYGYRTAREVVGQLIIDSGVPSRGHRKIIFGRAFQAAGVSCGPHRTYGAMCVIDFAGGLIER